MPPVTEAAEGIRIGTTDNDRLPIYDFDEYVLEAEIGEIDAGDSKIISFGSQPTFRPGQSLLAGLATSPEAPNMEELLILRAWYGPEDVNDPENLNNVLKVQVKNLHPSETLDFGTVEFQIGGWNTAQPPA